MKEGTVLVDLNIRTGVYPNPIIGLLKVGDKVYGNTDPASGWLIIQRIIRVDGTREDSAGWCSGSPSYITLVDYTPPPNEDWKALSIHTEQVISTDTHDHYYKGELTWDRSDAK